MSAFAVSIAGSVDTADQEAQLIEQLRDMVSQLPNVSGAFAHTQQYGQVNLRTGERTPAADTASATPDADAGPTDG